MEERAFTEQSNKPNEQTIQSTLGQTYPHYKKLIEIVSTFMHDWQFSKGRGWMLKVHDKKKALFYLIPFKNEFKISLTIREKEKEIFLKDAGFKALHESLKSAKKYSEGYAMQFTIASNNDYKIFESFLKKLISLRA